MRVPFSMPVTETGAHRKSLTRTIELARITHPFVCGYVFVSHFILFLYSDATFANSTPLLIMLSLSPLLAGQC